MSFNQLYVLAGVGKIKASSGTDKCHRPCGVTIATVFTPHETDDLTGIH